MPTNVIPFCHPIYKHTGNQTGIIFVLMTTKVTDTYTGHFSQIPDKRTRFPTVYATFKV